VSLSRSPAFEHSLKNISLELPRDRLIVFTGLSGSGKSSLAFDTIYTEGERRYVESLSAYARRFFGQMDKPDVDFIEGLSPAIFIDQKAASRNAGRRWAPSPRLRTRRWPDRATRTSTGLRRSTSTRSVPPFCRRSIL